MNVRLNGRMNIYIYIITCRVGVCVTYKTSFGLDGWIYCTPRRNHSLSIVEKVCLLIRCLAMDVLLRAYASAGMCLPSRCLTMSVYLTSLFRLSGVMSLYMCNICVGGWPFYSDFLPNHSKSILYFIIRRNYYTVPKNSICVIVR
jgi:hypothetical protein